MFPDSGFFLKRLDVFMYTHDSKVRYIINVTLPKWLHSSPGWYSERGGLCSHQEGHVFSHLAIMVLDVNFINPYKTAGFPFFNDKKADNSVVKRSAASSTSMWTSTFNNLRPLPKQPPHHIIIVSQCLMISWEKLFIDKIIRPKSKTYTVVQWQFFFLCGKWWGQYSWTTKTTAAQYVQRQFLFLYGKILQSITTKTTFGSRSWIAAQEKEIPNQIWGKPFFLCVSTVSALSHAICQSDSKVICISSDYCIKWDVPWVFEFCRLHGGQFQIFTPYWCSLHQASDCCRYFPSFTGTVTIGLLSICPRITSLKFLSCSPCAVPPFELYSGGVVVLIIASLMSWSSNQGNQSKRHFMAIFKHICLFSLLL